MKSCIIYQDQLQMNILNQISWAENHSVAKQNWWSDNSINKYKIKSDYVDD